jgi:hypothetical protein
MRRFFARIRRWLNGEAFAEEYFNRFIARHVDRAHELRIPKDELDAMWEKALEASDAYTPPGIILRRLIDEWEAQS